MFLTHGTAKLFGSPHVAAFDQLQLFSLLGLAGAGAWSLDGLRKRAA